MISSGGRQVVERLRAGLAEQRAVLDRAMAGYQESARAAVARMQVSEEDPREHHDAGDYDLVDSWMSDQWSGAPDERVADRGELTWGDILSGRASDPEAVAAAAAVRRLREARA